MKRLSIKIRLTLLYSFFMLLATGAALAILFSLSSREILASTQAQLEQRVQESVEEIRIRDGQISREYENTTRVPASELEL